MFCTIEDAWGEKNFTEKPIFQQSDKPEIFKEREHFGIDDNLKTPSKKDMYNQYMELKEMFGNDNYEEQESQVCLALDNHLAKCTRCRSKYLKQNNQKYFHDNSFNLPNFNLNIRSNKDIITIFLFGLLILLLLQLFSK
jgi:hypothetical protein